MLITVILCCWTIGLLGAWLLGAWLTWKYTPIHGPTFHRGGMVDTDGLALIHEGCTIPPKWVKELQTWRCEHCGGLDVRDV